MMYCSWAGLRLMTQLHYKTKLSTRLILYMEGDRTLSLRHIHTNATLFNPRESVEFDYHDFYKHTPYESRQSMHQRGRGGSGKKRKMETGRQRNTWCHNLLQFEEKNNWSHDVCFWMELLRCHNSHWNCNTQTKHLTIYQSKCEKQHIYQKMSQGRSCQCVHF